MVSKRGQGQWRGQELDKIMRLAQRHSSAEWPSLSEELSGKKGLLIKDLYSVFTFESLHSLHIGASKILKIRFTQHFSNRDVYSRPLDPVGK